jgi:hypothetical protein
MQGLHVDFVGRISADHVQNGQFTTGVFVDPFVQLQRVAFVDDNRLALGNQRLDFCSGQELLGRHYGGGCVGERARRRCAPVGAACLYSGSAHVHTPFHRRQNASKRTGGIWTAASALRNCSRNWHSPRCLGIETGLRSVQMGWPTYRGMTLEYLGYRGSTRAA